MTTEQPKLQEDMKIEEIDDDEIPELEDAPQKVEPLEGQQGGASGQTSRTEKKSRKAMQKLGLEPFNGVTSVQIKQAQVKKKKKKILTKKFFLRFSLQLIVLKCIKWLMVIHS